MTPRGEVRAETIVPVDQLVRETDDEKEGPASGSPMVSYSISMPLAFAFAMIHLLSDLLAPAAQRAAAVSRRSIAREAGPAQVGGGNIEGEQALLTCWNYIAFFPQIKLKIAYVKKTDTGQTEKHDRITCQRDDHTHNRRTEAEP